MSDSSIDWRRFNESKLNFISTIGFGVVHSAVFPCSLVKTVMQNASSPKQTLIPTVRELMGNGVQGLFKGYGATLISTIPSTMIYIGTVDKNQEILYAILNKFNIEEQKKIIVSKEGGPVISSLMSQVISVPGDIVRKTLMVQGNNRRMTGLEVIQKIINKEGLKGLYRGYGIPPMIPNVIWWHTYGSTQDVCLNFIHKSDQVQWRKGLLYQATGGFMAGAVTSLYQHPFDTVTTRLQVNHPANQTTTQIVRGLFKENGIKAFYKGYVPAVARLGLTGAAYAVVYENFKM